MSSDPGQPEVQFTKEEGVPQHQIQPQPGYGQPPVAYGQQPPPGYGLSAQGGAVASGLAMKRRNPVGVWLGLPIITLGIYQYVWYYKIHKEMAEFDRRRAVPIAGPVLVLIFLGWTIVGLFVSIYNTGKRINNAQRAAGLVPTCSAGLGAALMIVLGVGVAYYQSELNKIVDRYPGAAPGTQIPLFV